MVMQRDFYLKNIFFSSLEGTLRMNYHKLSLFLMLLHFYIKAIWSEWSGWGSCSTTCANGIKIRVKECVNPDFSNVPCDGEEPKEVQKCNDSQCRKCLSKKVNLQ